MVGSGKNECHLSVGYSLVISNEPVRIRRSATSYRTCAAAGVISPIPKSSKTRRSGLKRAAFSFGNDASSCDSAIAV